jgi:peroxiredoxin family protein
MSTDSGASESSAAPKGIRMVHAIYPEQDNLFRSIAVSSEFLKANKKHFGVQCTHCQTEMKKLFKCAKVMIDHLIYAVAGIHRVSQSAFSVRAFGIAQRR